MFNKFSKQPVGIKVAIITTIGAIIIGTFPLITSLIELLNKPEEITPTKITFRVTDISGVSVPQAKLILLSGNNILSPQFTDGSGFAKFSEKISGELRVFVESRGHEPFDQIIEDFSNTIQIRLEDSKGSVLVRVLDSEKNEPVNGAEVILIVNANKYSQISDIDGITKFTTGFATDEIDGDISVSFSGFNIRKKVTLQAGRIQDININKTTGSLTINLTDPQELPILPTPTTLKTVTPTAEACGEAPPKRLKKGEKAIVCTQFETVHLRENPNNTSQYSHRLVPGAELQVIGDAVCDEDASWWYWEVKTESGFEGWVAEGGDEIDTYFICPFK